jgi:hypothetical protein
MNLDFQLIDETKMSEEMIYWTYIPCFIIFILGLLGNLLTICKIVWDKSLHTPTYVAIGFLALSDFISLVFSALNLFTNIRVYLNETYYHDLTFLNIQDIYYILELMIFNISLCQIIVLVVLTVNPIECKIHATTSLIYNVCAWFTFRVVFNTLVKRNRNLFLEWAGIIEVTIRCTAMFFTLFLMAVLHYLKTRALNSSSVTCSVIRRMNKMVAIIVVIFAFYGVSCLLATIATFLLDETVTTYFTASHRIICFVHFSSNPFIYFIFAFVCKKML